MCATNCNINPYVPCFVVHTSQSHIWNKLMGFDCFLAGFGRNYVWLSMCDGCPVLARRDDNAGLCVLCCLMFNVCLLLTRCVVCVYGRLSDLSSCFMIVICAFHITICVVHNCYWLSIALCLWFPQFCFHIYVLCCRDWCWMCVVWFELCVSFWGIHTHVLLMSELCDLFRNICCCCVSGM